MFGKCFQLSRLRSRALALASLLGFVAAIVGIPAPVFHAQQKEGELFPCQNCPCGCNTAEQCWTNCCCFSPQERLAWAENHGVSIPKQAMQHLKQEAELAIAQTPAAGKACGSCCKQESDADRCASPSTPAAKGSQSLKWRWQIGVAAAKCRGSWLGFINFELPLDFPPQATTLAHAFPAVGRFSCENSRAIEVAHSPPAPYG